MSKCKIVLIKDGEERNTIKEFDTYVEGVKYLAHLVNNETRENIEYELRPCNKDSR